ncbi:hypothetical protein GCM10008934_31590 [Virgibacillus salarius]
MKGNSMASSYLIFYAMNKYDIKVDEEYVEDTIHFASHYSYSSVCLYCVSKK